MDIFYLTLTDDREVFVFLEADEAPRALAWAQTGRLWFVGIDERDQLLIESMARVFHPDLNPGLPSALSLGSTEDAARKRWIQIWGAYCPGEEKITLTRVRNVASN